MSPFASQMHTLADILSVCHRDQKFYTANVECFGVFNSSP